MLQLFSCLSPFVSSYQGCEAWTIVRCASDTNTEQASILQYEKKFLVLAVFLYAFYRAAIVLRTSRSTLRYAFTRIRVLRAYYAMFVSRYSAQQKAYKKQLEQETNFHTVVMSLPNAGKIETKHRFNTYTATAAILKNWVLFWVFSQQLLYVIFPNSMSLELGKFYIKGSHVHINVSKQTVYICL